VRTSLAAKNSTIGRATSTDHSHGSRPSTEKPIPTSVVDSASRAE